MFYRYEIRTGSEQPWEGCFQYFFPDQRRYIGRWLKEPKWYQNHPNEESKCWFTQEGYEKYGDLIEAIIRERLESNPHWEMRLLKTEHLDNVSMWGSVQCIQLI